jgi:hypothetical protein
MTTAGLAIYNDSGVLQIDEANANLVLRYAGQATTALVSGGQWCTVAFTITASTPVVAISSPDVPAFATVRHISGTSWEVSITSQGTTARTIQWYVFDKAPAVTSSITVGFQVFDSSGELVYSSDQRICRIKQLKISSNYDATGDNLPANPTTLTSGRTYAVAAIKLATHHTQVYFDNPFPGTYRYTYTFGALGSRVAANVISYGMCYLQNGSLLSSGLPNPAGAVNRVYRNCAFLMIDVTNYPTSL